MKIMLWIAVLSAGLPGLSAAADAGRAVEVYPARISLSGARDTQRLVVQATRADGTTEDLTGTASWRVVDPGLVRLDGPLARPRADGRTTIEVSVEGRTISIPVTVAGAAVEPPIDFTVDVMPVFLRAGCNSGSCHGASRGQHGFRLSVFGFDPDGDYHRLTREFVGRRINLAVPADSLLLTKPTEQVVHGGGQRFEIGSELYSTLYRWLKAGAPRRGDKSARPVRLEVFPPEAVLAGGSQRFIARATYSDGSDRDVTSLAVFSSSNETTAAISADGVLRAAKRGESFVLARFDAFSVGVPVIVVPAGEKFEWPATTEHNYIDTLVHDKLRKLRIVPSAVCDDATFIRRVTLDTIGLLPSPSEYQRFVADRDPKKREVLVDRLLQRREFSELWVMKWAEFLQIDRIKGGFFGWLAKNYTADVPIDLMVRELLTAEGGFFRDPPVQYFRRVNQPTKMAENVAQVFMGTRIQCAQCHNHPFDRWTMDDYYGFAAFFAQLGSKRNWEDTRELIVFNTGSGEVKHPQDQRVMAPKFLGGEVPAIKGRDRRAVLAEWLTAPENPWFAKNLANIAWAQYFGRGIVDPVDDVRISNPPSNPELLAELGRKLAEYRYDFRQLIRDIANSRTYQLVTARNESNRGDEANFSHAMFRRLRAEVLHDCLCQVTGSPSRLGGFPLGTRAVQLPVASMSTYFLRTFGRSNRQTVCSCEVDVQPTLSQALHLINGETTWGKIDSGPIIRGLLEKHRAPEPIVTALYIRCLGRPPTEGERGKLVGLVKTASDRRAVFEEIFWALLNSKEFLFNH